LRINKVLNISLSENVIKTIASGIVTNLASSSIFAIVSFSITSFFPGIGNVTSSAMMGMICYALTLVSGAMYIQILTKVFKAGKKPEDLTTEDYKRIIKEIIENKNIKDLFKKAKKEFKKKRKELISLYEKMKSNKQLIDISIIEKEIETFLCEKLRNKLGDKVNVDEVIKLVKKIFSDKKKTKGQKSGVSKPVTDITAVTDKIE